MRCPNIQRCLLIVFIFIIGCQKESNSNSITVNNTKATITSGLDPLPPHENKTLDQLLANLMLKSDFGHFVFSVPEGLETDLTVWSREQPELKFVNIGGRQFALTNLFPQKHTILISRVVDSHNAFAVFKDVEIEAGSFVEVGLIPFEKAGGIQGRFLEALSGQPLADVSVRINEIGFIVKSESNGEFNFPSLPAGRWELSASSNSGDILRRSWIEVEAGRQTDIGDLWLGQNEGLSLQPILANGMNGITSEPRLNIKLKLPQGARFVTVRSREGKTLLSKIPAREQINIPLESALDTTLEILVWNDASKLMGILRLPVQYDPFSDQGQVFYPKFEIEQRVIASPQRVFNLSVSVMPNNVSKMRISVNGVWGEWQEPAQIVSAELPKSNTLCGQNRIGVQFRNILGHESHFSEMPVTLSCWERISHRAAIDKIVGLKNAATWTGTHAFVWSGKQHEFDVKLSDLGRANSAESAQNLENVQKYRYLDSGYVFVPQFTPEGYMGRSNFEFIVTDNAPAPRASPGVAGRNNLVVVYGGENSSGPIADGALYDISSNGWVSIMGPGAPSPRIKPQLFFIEDNKILVWGGRTRTSLGYEVSLNDGAIYDTKTHQWRSISLVQAPGPRVDPVVVWTGSELFVIGGTVPGSVVATAVETSFKYNPQTDVWTPLPATLTGIMMMTGLYVDGHIIMYGHDNKIVILRLSDHTTTYSQQYPSNKMNIHPTLVLVGDGRGPSPSLIYVFGGRSSYVNSDPTGEVMILPYLNGQIDVNDPRKATHSNVTPTFTVAGHQMYRCCVDVLGFTKNQRVFALNGTVTRNLSIYAIEDDPLFDVEGENLARRVFVQEKGYSSVVMRHEGNLFVWASIDRLNEYSLPGLGPLGPYNFHPTSPPVWSSQERSLFWYGGVFSDPENRRDLQGGWMYNVDQKIWKKLPTSPTEPTFTDVWNESYVYSRMSAFNFFLGGALHTIGGYHRIGDSGRYIFLGYESLIKTNDILFNGFKTPIVAQNPATPVDTLSDLEDDFDFLPMNNAHSLMKWDLNSPCVVGNSVFFSGGRRRFTRDISGLDETRALMQDKVVYDGTTGMARRVDHGPMGVRAGSTVVSTGSHCFMWGGYKADLASFNNNSGETFKSIISHYSPQRTGALFAPADDTWQPLPIFGSPSERSFMHGVWTGTNILLWGGRREFLNSLSSADESLKGVWQFSPLSHSWTYLPPSDGEPDYKGTENPIWTGRHMLIWQAENSQFNIQFNPQTNTWQKLNMPYGFGYRVNQYLDNHLAWTGEKLLVMPIADDGIGLMALYVPPDP